MADRSILDRLRRVRSVEQTRELSEAANRRQEAADLRRQKRRSKVRGTKGSPSRKKIIKIDPAVKPIAPTLGPVGVIKSIAGAFKRAGERAKEAAAAAPQAVREQAQAKAKSQTGKKTVVPLRARISRDPRDVLFKGRKDPRQILIQPQKGREQLAREQGVPQKQTQQDLIDAAAARIQRKRGLRQLKKRGETLGGSRSDRSRDRSRKRGRGPVSRIPKGGIPTEVRKPKTSKRTVAGRVISGVVGAGIGLAAARAAGNVGATEATRQAVKQAQARARRRK